MNFFGTPIHIVDLTHTIHSSIPTWDGTCGFHSHVIKDYQDGCRVYQYEKFGGVGTHIDSPSHFIEKGRDVASLTLQELIVPLCIIDISHKIHPDYLLSADDVSTFEKKYGKIGPNSLVVAYTGWDAKWGSQEYRNVDEKGEMHFPGFSIAAAEILLERDVAGVGIDTLSPDGGDATHFLVHHLILGNDKYIIENLTGLKSQPKVGGYAICLPEKIQHGSEASARVVGLFPLG